MASRFTSLLIDVALFLFLKLPMGKTRSPFKLRKPSDAGFSLVELIVVVVIIGILATLATYGYGKWIGRARRSEAVALLAEMSAKEQVYLMEFGAYVPLRADNTNTINEVASAWYPIAPDNANFESKRTATSIANGALWPVRWRSVGLRPRTQQLYCTYILNAGPGNGAAIPAAATFGTRLLTAPGVTNRPWFYALAACNFSRTPGLPNNVHVMGVTADSPVLREWNEGE